MKLNSYRGLFEKLDTRNELDEKILAMARDAKEGNPDFQETAAFKPVKIAPQKEKNLKDSILGGFRKTGICAVVCALLLCIVWLPMKKGGVGDNNSYTSAVYEESMVKTEMTDSWESAQTAEQTPGVSEEAITQASAEEAGQIIMSEELQEIPEFTGELDFTYVFDTDAQGELGDNSSRAYTQDGYYHFEQQLNMKMLCFREEGSFQSAPVCSKSNCAHNNEDCDAYFDGEEYPVGSIWYYQENLYVLKQDGGYFCLDKVSTDGAEREKACTLIRPYVYVDGNTTTYYFPTVQIHRGYVYFTDDYAECPGYGSCSLYRVKLDSEEEAEVLFTLSENFPGIYSLKPYGRYVLFKVGNYDDSHENFSCGIYAYDTETGTVSRMSEEADGQYCICKQSLYYCDEQLNIIKKDLETGQVSLFYENPNGWDEDADYDIKLFPYGDELVFSIENINTRHCIQFVLDEDGTVTSTLQKKDGLIRPYTFE